MNLHKERPEDKIYHPSFPTTTLPSPLFIMRSFFLVLLTVLAITLSKADLTLKPRSHSLNEPLNFSPKFEKRQDKAKSKKSSEKNILGLRLMVIAMKLHRMKG